MHQNVEKNVEKSRGGRMKMHCLVSGHEPRRFLLDDSRNGRFWLITGKLIEALTSDEAAFLLSIY